MVVSLSDVAAVSLGALQCAHFIAAELQAEAAAFIIEPRKRYSGPTGAFLSMSIQASCVFLPTLDLVV